MMGHVILSYAGGGRPHSLPLLAGFPGKRSSRSGERYEELICLLQVENSLRMVSCSQSVPRQENTP